jgi:hypothetical protein
MYVQVDSKNPGKSEITAKALGGGKSYLNLRSGREMEVQYRGEQPLTEALRSGAASPRTLASADLDGDAAPDLVAGYSYGGVGILTVQRGNTDAFAPKDQAGYARLQQGYNPESLMPAADVYPLPVPVDFLATGNFNNDSRKDVLLAARGGGLYLLPGDGNGGFGALEQIALPGSVTALATGEFRAADGFSDLAVGVAGPAGPALLIFDDAMAGFSHALLQYQLSAPASAIEFGGLDDDPFLDVAVAAGSEVDIIHGWGRDRSAAFKSRVERINLENNARGLAIGEFVWDREGRSEIAALTDDGSVHILRYAKLDTRPFSESEMAQRTRARLTQKRVSVNIESVPGWQLTQAAGWTVNSALQASSTMGASSPSSNPLKRAHISFRETDDLMMLGESQPKLQIVRQLDANDGAQVEALEKGSDLTGVALDLPGAPAAVLALPQKLNGERDLVLLQTQSALPTIIPEAPTATPTVDRFDDPSGAGLTAASACMGAVSDCSLRGAVQVANANPGSTITLPAGTYTLAINGAGAGGCASSGDDNTIGDLGINASTTISGAGSATTIIRQHGTGDRVMCMNEGFLLNLNYTYSGITVTGGRDGTAFGGAGIIGGEKGNTLTLTGVVVSNNQATGVGNPFGGGGIQILGGDLTITNSTIGGANAPGLSTDRDTVANANSQIQSGGGISFTPSAPTHTASTGVLTVTGTTFNHNTAASAASGGGAADLTILALAFPGGIGTGSASFATSMFLNNQATMNDGGALDVESLGTTVATSSFTSNSAGNRGGAIKVAGGTGLTLDGTSPSTTFTSNTATNGGSSVSTAAAVNVSGTNVSIGGDIEITTGGVWTNNTGSTLSPMNVVITGGTLTCNNSTMNVGGNLSIAQDAVVGGTFNGNTGTVNIAGNFSFNSSGNPVGQFNAGTGTFNFNGSGAQSITNTGASITFFNLTDSNTTLPLIANNSFAVGGSLNVNGANAVFDPVAAAVISGAGTLTGTGTARVRRTAPTADFLTQYSITNKTLTNLTVEYIGGAAQVGSAITYGKLKINNGSGVNLAAVTTTVNGLLTLTAGALGVGANTLVINDGTSVGAGSLTSSATGTVNYNQSSIGQNVLAANYGNLTFSNFMKVLPASTVGVAGTFTPGTGVGHTITGNTFDFNGVGTQTVALFNYNNLTISGNRGLAIVTLPAGTIAVAGTFNPSATNVVYSKTGNLFDFNGAGAQSVAAFNYNDLTISGNRGGGAITLASGNIGVAGIFNPSATNNTYTTTGNTMIFNGTALQSVPAFAFNGLTLNNAAGANLGGAVAVNAALTLTSGALGVGTNTLTLNAAVSTGGGTLTSSATGTVNYNQGSNGQATVLAANYGNLTFSNFNKTLASSGTIGIASVFTPGTATGHTVTGSTINFSGAGSQNIPGFTYNNLTSSGAGVARILDPVNTIKIAGVFTPGTDIYTITGSTIEYNGSASQTLPATFTTYNNLTLNNLTTINGFAGLTVQGLLRVQAGTFNSSSSYVNVQIDPGATMAATAASTINVSGNWTNNGTFTASTSTVVFNGADNTQTISGNTTFNNLTVNHTGSGNVTASGSTLAATGLLRVQSGTFISSSTFNNVQIDSGTTLQSDGGTMNVSGNWTNNGGTFTPNGNTVNFNGSGAQSLGGSATTQTFDNFTVNKGGGTLTVVADTNTLDINGNVTLTLGTFDAGTATAINVARDWTNNGGVFTPGTGMVTFDGGVGQLIGGTTATTFNNLTNANANGLAMNNDNTVNGILALTSGDITVANTKTLTQPNTGSSSGTFDVIGNLKRTGFATAACPVAPCANTLSFGNPNNQITITAGTAPTDINVNLVKAAPVDFASAVQRNYTITPNGGSGITATLRLHYLDSELNGNLPETSLNLRRFNGTGWSPVVPTSSNTGDALNNWLENNAVSTFSQWTFSTFTPTGSNGVVTGRITASDGTPVAGAVVRLSGTQNRKFITDANGFYRFDNVETSGFYTVTPSRANYTFNPATRSFSQVGQTTEATFGATLTSGGFVNPLDTPEYFVRQHYLDFLGREPDEAGFNFWSDQILECGADQNCLGRRRENVSAAYFLSIEFQETGGLVDGLYRASYDRPSQFAEFLPDTRAVAQGVVVGSDGWEAKLAANKEAFVNAFVDRPAFHAAYDGLSSSDFVDALISHAGVSFTSAERDALVSGLANGTLTRAAVLRSIAEDGRFVNAKFNEAFVMMEYFGYLRRDVDADGFAFWLNKLNEFGGNFEQAEMVKAFIISGEFRDRFPR